MGKLTDGGSDLPKVTQQGYNNTEYNNREMAEWEIELGFLNLRPESYHLPALRGKDVFLR